MKKPLCDSPFPYACALLEGIATGTKDLIVALDSNFRCLFFNDAFRCEVKNLWGRDIDLGTRMMEVLEPWPEEQQKAIDLWQAALDGESFSHFWEMGPPKREKQIYDMHLYPVYDSDGGQIGAAQIMRNITERARMEQALRESEKRFRCLFENASEGILQIDAELRIIDANDRMAQMLGCPEQEIIGQDLSKFIAPEEISDLQKRLDNRRRGIKETFERKMVRKDGSAIWMSVSASQLLDDQGNYIGSFGIHTDITERKQIEKSLQQSESRLKAAVNVAQLGIWEYDPTSSLLHFDQRSSEIFGIGNDVPTSLGEFFELVHPKDRSKVEDMVLAALDPQGSGEYDTEFRIIWPDGTLRWVMARGNAVRLGENTEITVLKFIGTTMDITERKQAEEALRREAQILAQVHDSVIATDLEGTITLWNKGAELMYGYSSDEMLGQPASLIYFDEDRPSLRERMIEMRSTGSQEAEVRVRTKSGQPKLIHLSLSVMNADNGSPVGIIGYALDITQRKKAEESLAKSEEKYRAVFEQAAVGMGRVSFSDMQWIDVNNAFCRMLGYSREEMQITPWPQITHPDDLDSDLIPFRRMAAGELDTYSVEKRFIHKLGHHVWARLTLSLVRDSQGKPDYEVAIIENISERKHAEKALLESEQHLRHVLDNTVALIGIMDPNGILLEANRTALDVANLRPEDVLKKPFEECYWWAWSKKVQNRLQSAIAEVLRTKKSIRYDEVIRIGEGKLRTMDFMIAPLLDSDGQVAYLIPSALDITERKQTEKELKESHAKHKKAKEAAEKANRAKSEFLANMSHEIRTPMTVFLGAIEHLRKLNLGQEQWKWLEMADKSAQRLRSLIDDILDFSRIEAQQVEIRKEPFCLSSCIREAVNLLEITAREKDLELKIDLGSEVPETVIGDQDRLSQVLVNLINNAIKFTEQGKVEISAQVDDQNLFFKVRDTGIGIPEDKHDLLFHSFSQIDEDGSRKKSGTGLGLAICKGLVELMEGDIWLESGPGEGSTFSFRIPLNIPTKLTPKAKGGRPKPEKVKKKPSRILLVEDERMLRDMIYLILNQRGHQIEMVENGWEAVTKWQEDSFDLILMDMQMPEMNGMEATRKIRNMEKQKGVNPTRIIALSADVRKETKDECKAIGMDGFISKPIKFEELFSAIEA